MQEGCVPDFMKIDKQAEQIQLHSESLTVEEFAALFVGMSLNSLRRFRENYYNGDGSLDTEEGAIRAYERFEEMLKCLRASIKEDVNWGLSAVSAVSAAPVAPVSVDDEEVPF